MDVTYTTPGGETIELPRMTMSLSRKMDAVRAAGQGDAAYRAQYDLLGDVLGKDVLAEVVDAETLDDADLVALAIAWQDVESAYMAPVIDAQAQAIGRQAAAMRPAMELVESAASITAANRKQRRASR